FTGVDRSPGFSRLCRRADFELSLAVVSPPRRLEHRRRPQPGNGTVEFGLRMNGRKRSYREAGAAQIGLFTKAVLRGVQHRPGRPNWREPRGRLGRRCRDVFELEGHYRHVTGKILDRVTIVVRGLNFEIGDLPSGSVVVGRVSMYAVPHPPGGYRK